MLLSLFCTSHHKTLCLDDIFQADEESFNKWVDHREDHPDVNQLYVRSAWKGLADSKKAKKHSNYQLISNISRKVTSILTS